MSTVREVQVLTNPDCTASSSLLIGRARSPLMLSDGALRDVLREAERVAVALNVELYVDGACERTTI